MSFSEKKRDSDQSDVKRLQLQEDCFGDISLNVSSSHRDRSHHHQQRQRQNDHSVSKYTAPLLTSPPGLIRRFADCDLTGDCHTFELSSPEQELPNGSSIPGDNHVSQASKKLTVPGSKWTGRLFRSLKRSTSEKVENIEKGKGRRVHFKPVKDIFHLYSTPRLVRRLSFLDE